MVCTKCLEIEMEYSDTGASRCTNREVRRNHEVRRNREVRRNLEVRHNTLHNNLGLVHLNYSESYGPSL